MTKHYRRHREALPGEVIDHAARLYQAFATSLRDGELILGERDVTVTHASVRRRVLSFGADYAARDRPGPVSYLS